MSDNYQTDDPIQETPSPQTQDITESPDEWGKWIVLAVLIVVLIVAVVCSMGTRSPQSPIVCITPFTPSSASGSPAQQVQPTETAKAHSDSLDAYVAGERQRIDTWYASALAELQRWAAQRHKELDETERAAYLRCMQQIQNTQTVTNSQSRANSYGYGNAYVSPHGTVWGNNYTTTDGQSVAVTNKYVVGDPTAEYQKFLAQIKQQRTEIDGHFDTLRRNRDRAYNDIQAYANRIKAKEAAGVLRTKQEAQRRIQGGPGLLDGILDLDKGYSAVIDGMTVHEGSWIDGYRVQRISADSVQVEKNGQVMTLRLQ